MTKKKQVHPSIDDITRRILKRMGKKPSTALEEYVCYKVTNKDSLVIEERLLKEKEKELLEDKEKIEERLEDVQDQLSTIKDLKKSFNPLNSKEFDETVMIVTQMLNATKIQLESGKWNVPRTSIVDVARLCEKRGVLVEAVLSQVSPDLKQYLEGYVL